MVFFLRNGKFGVIPCNLLFSRPLPPPVGENACAFLFTEWRRNENPNENHKSALRYDFIHIHTVALPRRRVAARIVFFPSTPGANGATVLPPRRDSVLQEFVVLRIQSGTKKQKEDKKNKNIPRFHGPPHAPQSGRPGRNSCVNENAGHLKSLIHYHFTGWIRDATQESLKKP